MRPPDVVKLRGQPDLLALVCGPLELWLAPDVGGCIAAFNYLSENAGKTPILRGAETVPPSVLDAACFPLVPFSNRIRNGRFRFRDREVTLAANMMGDPSPLHGQGWRAAWTVERHGATEAALVYRHAPGEWPWAYEARQRFRLDAAGLHAEISCRNVSDEPMPCGLGFHPYFPCDALTRIDTRVERVWEVDDLILPTDIAPATGRYALDDQPACGRGLDNGYGGWGGEMRLSSPASGITRMASPDAGFFQIYSPETGGLLAAEPVSHANAALNEPEDRWAELGLRVLRPGEEMSLRMDLGVLAD